jgi:spore cortex formation protein SpoVR/YcgB (stage V sporulation)
MLQHRVYSGILTREKDTTMVLRYLADLWGYEVELAEVDSQTEAVLKKHTAAPAQNAGVRA